MRTILTANVALWIVGTIFNMLTGDVSAMRECLAIVFIAQAWKEIKYDRGEKG